MPLINCEINLLLAWSTNCVICKEDRATTFAITETKLYVPVVTLPTQGNLKLKQLKIGFNRKINWNKYRSKVITQAQNQYLDYLVDPNFHDVNGFFVLSFEIKQIEVITQDIIFQK